MVAPVATAVAEWTLCTASACFLATRLYIRLRVVKVGLQKEDVLLIISQFLFYCWISMDLFNITRGFMNNNHSYYQPLTEVVVGDDNTKRTVLKVVYASAAPYYVCLWFIKYAILGLYYRLVPTGTKTRYFLHATLAVAILGGLTCLFLNLFLCEPINSNWNLDTAEACYSSTQVLPFVISVAFNVVVDVCIFIIPFPILRTMHGISKGQKYGIIGTFSIGIITIIIAIVRTVILALTATISTSAVLTAVECFTSMVVACLPSMRVLLKSDRFKRRKKRQSAKPDYSDEAMNDPASEVSSLNAAPSPHPTSNKQLFQSHIRQEPSFVSYDNHTLVGGSEKSATPVGVAQRYNHGNINSPYDEEEEMDYRPYNSMRQQSAYPMEHIDRHNPDVIRQTQMGPLGHQSVHDGSLNTLHSMSLQQGQQEYHGHGFQGQPYLGQTQTYHGQDYSQQQLQQPINFSHPGRYIPDQPLPLPPRANNDDDDLTMPNYILHEPLPNPVI
jgi:hypothetical protein